MTKRVLGAVVFQGQWVSRGVAILAFSLFGTGAANAATVAIGEMALGDVGGYQQLSFYNLSTLSSGGCLSTEYVVCSGVTIDNWTLTLTFTAEGDTDPVTDGYTSPLVISSSGNSNPIGPFNGTTPYTGGAVTWQIPLYVGNSGEVPCPTCDYELTQVEFSGTIDPTNLPLYVGTDPNTGLGTTDSTFNAQSTFDTIIYWENAGGTDLTSDYAVTQFGPGALGDSGDVLVSDQVTTPPATPEPASLPLIFAGFLAIGIVKRFRAEDHFGL